MAAAPIKKEALPTLVVLELDYTEGGSSPWFISKGRSVLSSLTSQAEDGELFSEIARDGSMGTLTNFLDTAQPSVSSVALVCYILLGLVLLQLFLVFPVGAFGLRRHAAKVGLVPWLCCEAVLIGSCTVQLICLLSMIRTWYAMNDGLEAKTPEAYEWTFEMLRNYTHVTITQLKKRATPEQSKKLDSSLTATINSIAWIQGNASAWEKSHGGHTALKNMLTGPLAIMQMGLLALALASGVAAALLPCASWNKRSKALKEGKHSPTFVAFVVFAGAVLLCVHLIVTLPMIARWLPVCVLGEAYLCSPYRDGDLSVLDDGVSRVWPTTNRPEPFCRLVPSALATKCTAQNTTGIQQLPNCSPETTKPPMTSGNVQALLQALLQPPSAPISDPAIKTPAKKIEGDCFYPYKTIDTDMTSVCPLLSDELLGHWMALVLSAVFGILGSVAAVAIAIIFLAIGKKKKKPKKKIVRKRRKKERKQKSTQTVPTPPPPPPALPPAPEPSQVNITVDVPVPVPVMVPRRRPHHHCRKEQPIIIVSTPGCSQPQPVAAIMAAPRLVTAPQAAPAAIMPPMSMPMGVVSQVTAHAPTSPAISVIKTGGSRECHRCDRSRSCESAAAYTNMGFHGSHGTLTYAPAPGFMSATSRPVYSPLLPPVRRSTSLCTLRRTRTVSPASVMVVPPNHVVRNAVSATPPLATRRGFVYSAPYRF